MRQRCWNDTVSSSLVRYNKLGMRLKRIAFSRVRGLKKNGRRRNLINRNDRKQISKGILIFFFYWDSNIRRPPLFPPLVMRRPHLVCSWMVLKSVISGNVQGNFVSLSLAIIGCRTERGFSSSRRARILATFFLLLRFLLVSLHTI